MRDAILQGSCKWFMILGLSIEGGYKDWNQPAQYASVCIVTSIAMVANAATVIF
jgi:hypothetical protein